jgi:hypothetical protein
MILHQARNGTSSAREIRFSIANSPHTSSPFSAATFLYSREVSFRRKSKRRICVAHAAENLKLVGCKRKKGKRGISSVFPFSVTSGPSLLNVRHFTGFKRNLHIFVDID